MFGTRDGADDDNNDGICLIGIFSWMSCKNLRLNMAKIELNFYSSTHSSHTFPQLH